MLNKFIFYVFSYENDFVLFVKKQLLYKTIYVSLPFGLTLMKTNKHYNNNCGERSVLGK